MKKRKLKKKVLTAAILCALLTTGGSVFAANHQTTSTVTSSTNMSTSDSPYNSIQVSGTTSDVVYGIKMLSDATADMTVYVTSNNVLTITAKNTSGNSYAYGVENVASKTLTIDGTLSGTVAATGGNVDYSEASAANTSASTYADAVGLDNSGSTLNVGAIENLAVTAAGGTSKGGTSTGLEEADSFIQDYADAYGVRNVSTLNTGKISNVTVMANGGDATGGTASSTDNSNAYAYAYAYASASATAYGLYNDGSKFTTGDISNLTVTANGGNGVGGTASVSTSGNADVGASADVGANAWGIYNNSGAMSIENIRNMTVTATGGTAIGGTATGGAASQISAPAYVYAEAYGLSVSGGSMTVGDLSGVTVTAKGGTATIKQNDPDMDASARAYGVYANDGTLNVTGNVELKNMSATAGTKKDESGNISSDIAVVYSLYATNEDGEINMGVDTASDNLTANGKIIQLAGDVAAVGGGTVNLILSGSDSYLQGNILSTKAKKSGTGTNNITVTNGATWRPVYDNRYGSFITRTYNDDTDTYTYENIDPAYTTTDNSAAALTLSNGGKIDLTWDDPTRDPAVTQRKMTIGSLTGDDGILMVNTNLAKNIADEFTITNNAATKISIDVKYDPALAANNLTKASDVSGKAKVLTVGAGTTPVVKGVADSYNLYDYTPNIIAEGNDYYVDKLDITNASPAPTPTPTPGKQTITTPSRPMRDARHSRMALHNLWVNGELNNMSKRMGDLRAMEPAEAGIWARYEHNKLEHGDNATLKYNYFQVGYDKDFAGTNGTTYRGAAMSYAKGTGDYEIGDGDLKEVALSLYQTWVGKNGRYYDVILKGGKLMNSYDLTNTTNPSTADYHTWGYAISGELGKRIYHGNGVYVEPQAELTLGRINSSDYTTSTGMHVDVDAQNTAITRLGVAIGKELQNGGSYYFKASYFHDFGGGISLTASDDMTNPFHYGEDNAKNWCIFTLGGTIKAGSNCDIYGEFSKYTGELTNNLQYNVGARWKI